MRVLALRIIAHSVLALLAGALVLPVVAGSHRFSDVDPDCGSPIGFGTDAADRVQDGRPRAAAGHCALCHWMRTIATATPRLVVASTPVLTAAGQVAATRDGVRPDGSLVEQPSRAPPATGL